MRALDRYLLARTWMTRFPPRNPSAFECNREGKAEQITELEQCHGQEYPKNGMGIFQQAENGASRQTNGKECAGGQYCQHTVPQSDEHSDKSADKKIPKHRCHPNAEYFSRHFGIKSESRSNIKACRIHRIVNGRIALLLANVSNSDPGGIACTSR
jgi:hypothetical protein